jgi:hypothetical protein
MTFAQSVQTCRWAEPTLFLQRPLWLDAWDYPWGCAVDAVPHVLSDVTICHGCRRWAPLVDGCVHPGCDHRQPLIYPGTAAPARRPSDADPRSFRGRRGLFPSQLTGQPDD